MDGCLPSRRSRRDGSRSPSVKLTGLLPGAPSPQPTRARTRLDARRQGKSSIILANGLDKIEPEQLSANQPSLPLHANIRGNDYYHSKEER